MGREDSPLRDRVIFVVGARRSGTNWVQRMLATHTEVASVPSETYVFSHGVRPLANVFQHANPGSVLPGQAFVERESYLDAVRDLVDQMFTDTIARVAPRARYVVERTPWHVYELDLISQVYPDARVIHIIRDGRAVARSLRSMSWGPSTIPEAAEEWRSSVEAGRASAQAFGPRYVEVFYERLLADPVAQTSAIFDHLRIPLDVGDREQLHFEARRQLNSDPVSPGVAAEKWRTELSGPELRSFNRSAGNLLETLGYPRDRKMGPSSLCFPPLGAAARVRAATSKVRRPHSALSGAFRRREARWAREALAANHRTAERFINAVADGRWIDAAKAISPGAHIRIAVDGRSWEGHGQEAIDRLLDVLRDHAASSSRALSGTLDATPRAYTAVGSYELNDGTRWARTMVMVFTGDRMTRINLYRFRLGDQGVASVGPSSGRTQASACA